MLEVAHKFILARILFIVSGDLKPVALSIDAFLEHLNMRISNNMIIVRHIKNHHTRPKSDRSTSGRSRRRPSRRSASKL